MDLTPQKKPYTTPKVTNYGDVRKVTQTVGNRGSNDGGGPPRHKTSL